MQVRRSVVMTRLASIPGWIGFRSTWTRRELPLPLVVSPMIQRGGVAGGDRTETREVFARFEREIGDLPRRGVDLVERALAPRIDLDGVVEALAARLDPEAALVIRPVADAAGEPPWLGDQDGGTCKVRGRSTVGTGAGGSGGTSAS